MNKFKDELISQFELIFKGVIATVPSILKFVAFVLIAWLLTKIILWVVKKVLVKSNVDKWSEKLSETKIFGDTTVNIVLTKVIVGVVRWFLILAFVMAGAGIFGLTVISNGISSFFAYLPRLLTAIAIFAGGIYLGTVVKNAIKSMFKSLEINGGNLVGNIIFYLIVVFLSITALDQAGVDTSIIKSNLTLLIGSILLAFTIAFGLGARDAVTRLLFGYYSRKNIGIGQSVKINDVEGTVLAIDNISLTLATDEGKVVFPIKDIVDSKVIVRK